MNLGLGYNRESAVRGASLKLNYSMVSKIENILEEYKGNMEDLYALEELFDGVGSCEETIQNIRDLRNYLTLELKEAIIASSKEIIIKTRPAGVDLLQKEYHEKVLVKD